MILVRSLPQLLSGNKLLLLSLIFLYSCSPKIRPTVTPVESTQEEKTPEEIKDINKSGPAKIALIMPFKAETANLNLSTDMESSSMAIDFYQGFMIGIDSASKEGRNYEIQVLDSESKSLTFETLKSNSKVSNADVVIGPVFPSNIRRTDVGNKYFVSPIAAADPTEFKNSRLISLTPNIKLHASGLANYIKSQYTTENSIVVLLNGAKADQVFGGELKKLLNPSERKYVYQEYQAISEFETKIQKGVKYAVVLTSFDKTTVNQTMDRLIALQKRYGISFTLFGHPNWEKQGYTTEKLQSLNTTISSGHYVDFKASNVSRFVLKYRSKYSLEPTEFSFKGFDAGYYFAKLQYNYSKDYPQHLIQNGYKGLHNSYNFVFSENSGYMNRSVWILRYKDFQLQALN